MEDPNTRDLLAVFRNHANSDDLLTETSILAALRDVGVHPSRLQIREMIQSCKDCFSTAGIPYPAFCLFVQEFRDGQQVQRQLPRSVTRQPNELVYYNEKNQETVFLGGSCNPTTWRQELAIPFFTDRSIPFYNPQVSDWKQELVEIENAAKNNAELLFFVIDINQTRSASSMIEAAYLAACDRQLILVMHHFKGPDLEVRGEKITESEFIELRRSQEVVMKNVELMQIPVFRDIETGLHCAAKVIKEKLRVQNLTLDDGARPLTSPDLMIARSLLKHREVFNSYDKDGLGSIGIDYVRQAYKELKGCELNCDVLYSVQQDGNNARTFSFTQFCEICSMQTSRKERTLHKFFNAVCQFSRLLSGLFRSPERPQVPSQPLLYLGACRYDKSTWREDVAIPLLKKNTISYICPLEITQNASVGVVNDDRALRDTCDVLLYVINANTRGLATMCQVSFFIGLGCRMVLCVQQMNEEVEVNGEELTTQAVKDYNRGRVYLSDLASRENIPVFDDVKTAVHHAVQVVNQLKGQR